MVQKVLSLFSFMVICFLVYDVPLSYSQAFPSTPVLDDFNRSDQGPPGGPNWVTSAPSNRGLSVKNNQAVGATTTTSYASVWMESFSQDQEVYFTYGATPGTHACMGPSVRVKTPNDWSSEQYLLFFCQDSLGLNKSTANIWRRANNSWTLIKKSTVNADITSGDQIGLRAVGNKIEAFFNGNVVSTVVDANPVLGGGYLQLYVGDDVGHIADNFGGGDISSSPPSGGGNPGLTTPQPGSILPGVSATFSWTSNGSPVTKWAIQGGSTFGGGDLFDDGGTLGTNTTFTATNLPTDGRTIYIQLWYLANGSWDVLQVQYTAASSGGGSGSGPTMLAPALGSVLPGSSATFSWTSNGSPVTKWALEGGSALGGGDLFHDGGTLGANTTFTATNLPTDGRTIYIQLWYLANGSWDVLQVQYTAASSGGGSGSGPTMLAPALGSVLPGSSATFSWTSNGSPVTKWALEGGSALGGGDLFHDGGTLGANTTFTATNLPTDGRTIYIQLWYLANGSWDVLQVQYTAASSGGGSGSGPTMLAPALGSVLPGSSVTFSWSANGVSEDVTWWIHVGTSQGTKNIKNTGAIEGSTLSTTISGLPTNGSPVWVRLWFSVPSGWEFIDVQYTAHP